MPSSPPAPAFLGHRVLWSCSGGRRPTDSTIDTAFPARFSGESLLFPYRARAASARPPTTAPSPSPPIGVCRGQRWRAPRDAGPVASPLVSTRREVNPPNHWVNISHSGSLSFDLTFYFEFWVGTLAQGDFLFFFFSLSLFSFFHSQNFVENWSVRGTVRYYIKLFCYLLRNNGLQIRQAKRG